METGWTISITDRHAKDKVYKYINGDLDKVEAKLAEYQKRYDAIEVGRFSVSVDAQYSEFTSKSVCKLKCSLQEGSSVGDLQSLLSLFDVFISGKEPSHLTVETPMHDVEAVSNLLRDNQSLVTLL